MNQALESALKVVSNNINEVPDEALSEFVRGLDVWIDEMINRKKTQMFGDRKIKKLLLECITKLTLVSQKSAMTCIVYAEQISVIFSKLLNPYNDGEIVQQSWMFQIHIIRELMKTGKVPSCIWFKDLNFSILFSKENEKNRINVGSKGQPTPDLMHWMCLQLVRHVNPTENPIYFYYWWQLICNKIIPFLLTKSFLDHRFSKSLSTLLLNFLINHLNSQSDYSPFGDIITFQGKSSDPIIADKTAQFLNFLLDTDQELAYSVLKCINLLFPIKVINVIEEDTQKYPIGIHYELSTFDIQPLDRFTATINILSSDVSTHNSTFYYLQKILFDLMNILKEKNDKLALRDHILLTRSLISMRTKKLLETNCQTGFIETISSLICLMEPSELFPQLVCIFLAILYDCNMDFKDKIINCAKSIRRKAEEICKKETIKNILMEYAAHVGTALLRPLLGVTMVPCDINLALKCPTLYANVHIIQNGDNDANSDYQFLFLKSVQPKKDAKFNPESIISILTAFDPIAGYSVTPAFAESLYNILLGVATDMPYDSTFLFDKLLPKILEIGAKRPIDMINVNYVVNVIMTLFNCRFTTLKHKKKNSSLFIRFCLRFLCQMNIPIIFFGAIHALMEGVTGTAALIPLLMTSLDTYIFQNARIDQHPQILSFLATVISITRNVKDFKLPEIFNEVAGREHYVEFSYNSIISPLSLSLVEITNPSSFNPDFILNGYDSFISTIFIDELLNGNPNQFTWQIDVMASYLSFLKKGTDPLYHDEKTPSIFFDLPLSFLMIDEELIAVAVKKIPFIFDLILALLQNILSPCQSCYNCIETQSEDLHNQKNKQTPHCSIREAHIIYNFVVLSCINLTSENNSKILDGYLKLLENNNELCKELEEIKKSYRNFLFVILAKQCSSVEIPNDIDFIVLNMSSMLQLCMNFDKEKMNLYLSTPSGSAVYSINIKLKNGPKKDNKMRRGNPTTVIDAIGRNEGLLLLLEIIEESCNYHLDALTMSEGDSLKACVRLAQGFSQRMNVDLTAVSIFFIPCDKIDQSKDPHHLFMNTKWENTSKDFRDFVASLGVFRNTRNIIGMHQKEWDHCIFSQSIRHQIIYHVAPLIAQAHSVTQEAMQSVITIVWVDGELNETQKISGTNVTIFVRRLPNGLIQGKTKFNSGATIARPVPPTFVLPTKTFSKVLELSIKAISSQFRNRNLDNSFKFNWDSFQSK